MNLKCYLASVVALDTPGTETGGGKNEDLLRHCVDLPHALVVVHDGDPRLPDPQRNGAG